jgi:hypothetical protein
LTTPFFSDIRNRSSCGAKPMSFAGMLMEITSGARFPRAKLVAPRET